VKRAFVDARVGAFVYDQRLASYAFAAKSFDAVWDSNLEGFRCPPGSGGGQLTNDFGREYGPAVTRRLVAEFDGDDTKILGRRFNRGAGNRIGRTRRRITPDISPGALARRRSVASGPNADERDGDGDGLIFDNTPKEQPARSGAEQIRDLVAASQLPSRSGERNASVDVARQKTPKTPSRVRKATVRDELPAASKPVVADSPSEAFIDTQDELSALSEEAQRLLFDPRGQLATPGVFSVNAEVARSVGRDFEDFWEFETRNFKAHLDEMEKLRADLDDFFDLVNFDSLYDEELETLNNSYNNIYDDVDDRYDLNLRTYGMAKGAQLRSWDEAKVEEAQAREERATDLRQQELDANERANVESEAITADEADLVEDAELLQQIIAGTSGMTANGRWMALTRMGITTPSLSRQRSTEPLSPSQQALLDVNDEILLDNLSRRLSDAIQVTDAWQLQGEQLTDMQLQAAKANVNNLLEYWVRATNGDNPQNGISVAAGVDAEAIYEQTLQLWENSIARNDFVNAEVEVDRDAEYLRQVLDGTSTLNAFNRQTLLTRNGVTAPSFAEQREAASSGTPISPGQQALLDANNEEALSELSTLREGAASAAERWKERDLDETDVEIANTNLTHLLSRWTELTGDNPSTGMSLDGSREARKIYNEAVELWENAITGYAPPQALTEEAKAQLISESNKLVANMAVAQDELDKNPSEQSRADFYNAQSDLRGLIREMVNKRKNDEDIEFYDKTISEYRKSYFRYLKKDMDSLFQERTEMLSQIEDIQSGDASDSYISRYRFDLLEARIGSLPGRYELEVLFRGPTSGGALLRMFSEEVNDIDLVNDYVEDIITLRTSLSEIPSQTSASIRPNARTGSTRPILQMEKLSDDEEEEFLDKPYELIATLDSLSNFDEIIENEREFRNTERNLLFGIQKLNRFAERRYDGGDFESFQKATNIIKKSESYLSKLGIARVEYLNEQDLEGFDIVEQRRKIDAAISTHFDVHNAYEQLVSIEEKAEFIINRVRDGRLNVLADHVVERYGQTDAPWLDPNYNPQNLDDFYDMYDAAADGGDKAAEDAMWRWAQSVWGHSVEDGSVPIRSKDGSLFKTVLDKSDSDTKIPNSFYGNIFKFNEDVGDWEQVGNFKRVISRRSNFGDDSTYNAYMYMGPSAGFYSRFAKESKNSGFQTVFNPHAFMWLNAAGFKATEVTPTEDGRYVWARLGFRPRRNSYYRQLSEKMKEKVEAYRDGLDSVVLNDAQAALLDFLINKSEASDHSHLSAPGLGEYLAVLEFSEINSTMTARERSAQMRNEPFGPAAGGFFNYEGNVARDPRDLTTRARWES
jgi:hypothetical protein